LSFAARERHRNSGTPFSFTRSSLLGTPALRKYFCAITSLATWLQPAGTSISSRRNTVLPSGLRISELVVTKSSAA
jgi:hypothetical protein